METATQNSKGQIFIECDHTTILNQIGADTFFAISGGRVMIRPTGVTLKVSNGYAVEIDLAANDTYTVRRTLSRGLNYSIKGEMTDVYCDELSEVAWAASCFRSYEFGLAA